MRKTGLFLSVLLLAACNQTMKPVDTSSSSSPSLNDDNALIRAQAFIQLRAEKESFLSKLANLVLPVASATNPTNISISISNASSVSFNVDLSQFIVPTITSDPLSFGSLTVSQLKDNNVKLCGIGSNQRCGHAVIRTYTSGQPGAGLWNSVDLYGAPISAGTGMSLSNVGLGSANSVALSTYAIPGSKNVIRDTDFLPQPLTYNVSVDMSNAGAGNYSSVLVIEYVLQP